MADALKAVASLGSEIDQIQTDASDASCLINRASEASPSGRPFRASLRASEVQQTNQNGLQYD